MADAMIKAVIRILKQLLRVLHRGVLARDAEIELGGDHDAIRIHGERRGSVDPPENPCKLGSQLHRLPIDSH